MISHPFSFRALLIATLCLPAFTAQAALIDLGNGLIEDTDQNLYWMKDATLYVTACLAAAYNDGSPEQALWDAYDPQSVPGSSGLTKEWICDPFEGVMNWYEAEAWIAVLNAQNYKGYNDWRQPATTQPDPTCEVQLTGLDPIPDQGFGYNCRGSELGYLFNVALGNPNDSGDGSTGGTTGIGCFGSRFAPDYCLQNKGPFLQMQPRTYWSKTSYALDSSQSWNFSNRIGSQVPSYHALQILVWPVRTITASSAKATSVPLLTPVWLTLTVVLIFTVAVTRFTYRNNTTGTVKQKTR